MWTAFPGRPTLLDVQVQRRGGEAVLDEFKFYTALRSVDIVRGRFMPYGRPYPLRIVLDQTYWPGALLAAPSDNPLRRDVELARAIDFNGMREHPNGLLCVAVTHSV